MFGFILTASLMTYMIDADEAPAAEVTAASDEFVAASDDDSGGELIARITGFRNHSGQVIAVVFDQSEGFPGKRDKAVRKALRPISGDTMILRFTDLPPGEYAIAFVHDENGNHHLDRNRIGYPQEGIGVSNEDKVGLRIPTFKRAKFQYDGSRHVESMRVKYI